MAPLSIPLLLAVGLCLPAFGQDEDPVEVLTRLRDRVLEHGNRIPNHTCVETVERDRYEPTEGRLRKSCDDLLARRKTLDLASRLQLDTSDRLRLDVLLAADREIYSWAGASRFDESELEDWLPAGAIGTGPFAAMLLAIFDTREPHFVYEGDSTIGSRAVFEYSFAISEEQSHYRVKAGSQYVVTGKPAGKRTGAGAAEAGLGAAERSRSPNSTDDWPRYSRQEAKLMRFSSSLPSRPMYR